MPSKLLLSAVGDSEISNDSTEQTIFTGTVPGGTLSTNHRLILRGIGDILNNSGSAATATLRVKWGGVTIHTFTTISLASNANRYADQYTVFLGAENATGSQRSYMEHKQGGQNSATGLVSNGNDHNNSVNSAISVDSTTDQTFAVTVQLSAANANLKYRRRGVWVELHSDLNGDGSKLVLIDENAVTYNNDSTEHTILNTTIPAGTLGSGNLLIVRLDADVLNNSGSNARWYSKASLGGSLVFDGSPGVINATSASLYCFTVEYWIGGAGATNAQALAMSGQVLSSTAGSGAGDMTGTTGWQANNSTNAATADSTTALAFSVTNTFDLANAATEFRYRCALLAVIK